MKALILFSSRDGQTQNIAVVMAKEISKTQPCDVINIIDATVIEWENYDRVLIGASVRYGRFHPAVAKFISRHLAALQIRPGGFFSVSLTARKPDKQTPQTNVYTRKFLLNSPWKPDCCSVFAGALRYPRYRWFDRLMIQLIMHMTGGETNTSKEIDYTDWQQVTCFARNFSVLSKKRS